MAHSLLAFVLTLALVLPGWAADPGAPVVPDRAHAVLEQIQQRHGAPPPGHVGGRVFQNREHRLPRGRYREYDVNARVPGKDRGPERLVIERDTGRAWYTADHYRTFLPMERP